MRCNFNEDRLAFHLLRKVGEEFKIGITVKRECREDSSYREIINWV